MDVSSSGMVETRFPEPHSASGLRSGSWLTTRLDRLFLPKDPHELAPGDRSRSRVVAITAGVLLVVTVLFQVSIPEEHGYSALSLINVGCAVGYVSTLLLLRSRRSPWLPSLLLCLVIAGGYISANLAMGYPGGGSALASPLLTLLAFFLLGARGGFFFAAVMSLYALVLQPLFLADTARWLDHTRGGLLAVGDFFAAVCNMGVWGLSWLHSRSREQAMAALEQTIKSQHESERKLSSMLESTDDIVCSLDAQGRLLTANAAMRKWFSRLFGQEPRLGAPITCPAFMERHPEFPESFARALSGERVRVELVYPVDESQLALDFSLTPILGEDGQPEGVTIFGRDTSARRQAEARLSELHRTLLETSRKAGMAEIATGVLHNVGNTLNSVNVSASLVAERLRGSRVAGIVRATELMREHTEDLGTFLTRDERGRLLPEYLLSVSKQLAEEQATMLVEVQSLTKNVEHIKSVVSMQQEHARFGGVQEQVAIPELLDDALRLHATSFERLGIQVHREYASVPPIMVDRHKLLQILVNLLSNARHALLEGTRPDKQLTLRVSAQPRGRLWIQVADNGVGIAPEHLPRIFTQGFTTKKDGHGFGLHASALAAHDMNGSLTCASPGPQQGATFTIELPLISEQASA
jgi:PAS domain S-box-containing protein